MRKSSKYHNDFEVDRLTNSILNCISGGSFPTDVLLLSKDDLKQILKKTGWRFNWKNEMAQTRMTPPRSSTEGKRMLWVCVSN